MYEAKYLVCPHYDIDPLGFVFDDKYHDFCVQEASAAYDSTDAEHNFSLAQECIADNNYFEAGNYYKKAALQGHIRGQYNYGVTLSNGESGEKEPLEEKFIFQWPLILIHIRKEVLQRSNRASYTFPNDIRLSKVARLLYDPFQELLCFHYINPFEILFVIKCILDYVHMVKCHIFCLEVSNIIPFNIKGVAVCKRSHRAFFNRHHICSTDYPATRVPALG